MPKDKEERPRRSTGNVREPGDGYLPNGQPDLRPSAGYDSPPVQYSDESDSSFQLRVADFETRKAHAEEIEAGGPTLESAKKAAKERYDAEIASLERQEAEGTLRKE
jgi:hypothetical protein